MKRSLPWILALVSLGLVVAQPRASQAPKPAAPQRPAGLALMIAFGIRQAIVTA